MRPVRSSSPTPLVAGARSRGIQSLDRAFTLVDVVAAAGEIGLTELAAEAGLAISTAHGLARTMVARQYLVADRGRYRLGPAMGVLAERWDPTRSLGPAVDTALARLVAMIGHPATATVLVGREAHIIGYADASGPVPLTPHRITWTEPFRLATGRVLVALLREPGWPTIIADSTAEPSWSRRRWIDELRGIARTGMALKTSPHQRSLSAIAVPVWTAGSQVACSIGCSAPAFLTRELVSPATLEALWTVTRELSATLGCPTIPITDRTNTRTDRGVGNQP